MERIQVIEIKPSVAYKHPQKRIKGTKNILILLIVREVNKMTEVTDEKLKEEFDIFIEPLSQLKDFLAVSAAAVEHLCSQLEEFDRISDPFILVGGADAARGLLVTFSCMRDIVREMVDECLPGSIG